MGFDGSLRPRSTPVQRPPFVGVPYQQPSQSAGIAPHPLMHVHPPVNVPIPASTIAPPPQVGPEGNTNNGVHTVGTVINDSPPDEPAHHMEVEEEKEGHGRTLSRRISALRESGIGLDVEFHVGPSHNLKIVRAHRAVLASGSKAFEKLLYDVEQNAPPNKKCKQSNSAQCDLMVLEYQDVNPIAFDTIINFLYSDFGPKSINIDEAVVLDTLYAARKFDVEQVESACIMLLGDLTPSVAVALLGQAKKHCSEQLMQKCLEVIDAQTDDALAADSWTRLSKEMLKTVVERSELAPSEEIMVFRAVCAWADAECARAGCKSATSQKKRDLLGDVFNAVRFPTMSVSEFAEVANSGMLTDEEIGLLFRYISSTIRPALNLPFPTSERRYTGRSKHVVKRFMTISNNPCRKLRSSIWFIVNREILVTALGIYGVFCTVEENDEPTEWETVVDIEIACSEGNQNVKDRTTVTLKGVYGDLRPLLARFRKPVHIIPNIPHRATVQFKKEVGTFAGSNGAEDVRVHVGPGGAAAQELGAGGEGESTGLTSDPANIVHFAFHNDDPNGIRRGMTRGPAVFTNAIGGFYNRPAFRSIPHVSEGCLYEGQIPEIHFLAPALPKQEVVVDK